MAATTAVPAPQPSIYGSTPPPVNRALTPPGALRPLMPAQPGTPAQAPGTFSATNNMINSQINPTASPQLDQYRSLLGTATSNLTNLPDRYATAQSQFDNFAKSTEPQYQADLADATKLGAANGTLGSGVLGDRYGSIANQRSLALDTERTSTLNDALNQSINDRYNTVGALNSVTGNTAAQEAAARGEQRTERGYQYGQSQDATQSAIQQYLAQQQGQNQNFQQGVELQQLGTAPTSTALNAYNNASGQYGQDAAGSFGALGQSLNQSQIQQILASLGKTGTPAPGTTVPTSGTYAPDTPTYRPMVS